MIIPISLNGGDPRQQQGWLAKANGFFSPISNHILCFEHSWAWQPLQPAMVEDRKNENYRCCPFCKGKRLHPEWVKSQRMGVKRARKYLRTVLTKYVNSCEPPDIIKKYLTNN